MTDISSDVRTIIVLFFLTHVLVYSFPTTNRYIARNSRQTDSEWNTGIIHTPFNRMQPAIADSMAVQDTNANYAFQTIPKYSNPSQTKACNSPTTVNQKKFNEIRPDAKTVQSILDIMLSSIATEQNEFGSSRCNSLVEKRSTDVDEDDQFRTSTVSNEKSPNVFLKNDTAEANNDQRKLPPESSAMPDNRLQTQPIIHSHIPVGLSHVYSSWSLPSHALYNTAMEPYASNQLSMTVGQTFNPYIQPYSSQIYGPYIESFPASNLVFGQSPSLLPIVLPYDSLDIGGFVKRLPTFRTPVFSNPVQQYWHSYPIAVPSLSVPTEKYSPKKPNDIRILAGADETKINSTDNSISEMNTPKNSNSNKDCIEAEPADTILSQKHSKERHYKPSLQKDIFAGLTPMKKPKLSSKNLLKLKPSKIKDELAKLTKLAQLDKEYQNKRRMILHT